MVTLAIDGRLSGVRTGLLWGVRAAVIADIQQGGPRGNNFVAHRTLLCRAEPRWISRKAHTDDLGAVLSAATLARGRVYRTYIGTSHELKQSIRSSIYISLRSSTGQEALLALTRPQTHHGIASRPCPASPYPPQSPPSSSGISPRSAGCCAERQTPTYGCGRTCWQRPSLVR